MRPNALKFATWLIALLIVTLLYELASDGESMLASSFGVGVLVLGLVFRRMIFRSVHRLVEGVLVSQTEKVFGVVHDSGETFDAQAAIDRHLARRSNGEFDVDAAFDRHMAKKHALKDGTMPSPPEAAEVRPQFGRKGL